MRRAGTFPFVGSVTLIGLLASACATPVSVAGPKEQTPVERDPTSSGAGGTKPAEPVVPKLSARAQRLFDEAVAADAEAKKQKVPTDYNLLERKWQAVLQAEDVPEAHYNLGVIYERQRKPADARRSYERALSLKPTLKDAAVNLAVMMEGDGNTQAAIATYSDVLRKYPEDATSRTRLAALYPTAGCPA